MPYINAQSDSTKKGIGLVVKTDVLFPIVGLFSSSPQNYIYNYYCSFTVEKLFKKRHSVQLTFFENWFQNTEWTDNKLALIPEYKFFVSKKKAHTGYYIGAFGEFYHEKVMASDAHTGYTGTYSQGYKLISLGGGISNGVQFYVFKKITIDVLLGVGIIKPVSYYDRYSYYKGIAHPLTFPNYDYQSYFTFRGAINIGYKF